MSSFKIYRWHPVGDTRTGANGLLAHNANNKPSDERISIPELKRYAEVLRRGSQFFVSERVANALVIWNAGGFEREVATHWEYVPATTRTPTLSRQEFLEQVIRPAFELDTADAIRAGGGEVPSYAKKDADEA